MHKIYWNYIHKNWYKAVSVILLGNFLGNAVGFMMIPLYKEVITVSMEHGNGADTGLIIAKAVLLLVLYFVSVFFSKFMYPRFLTNCKTCLKKEFAENILSYNRQDIQSYTSGDYLVAFEKINYIPEYCFNLMLAVIKGLLILGLIIYIICAVHWSLVVILIGLILIMMIIQSLIQPLQNKQGEIWAQEGRTMILMDSEIKNIHLIKSFMVENQFNCYFRSHISNIIALEKTRNLLLSIIEIIQQLTKITMVLATPLICWALIKSNIVTISAVVVASFSFFLMANSFIDLIGTIQSIGNIKAAFMVIDKFFCVNHREMSKEIDFHSNETEELHEIYVNDVDLKNGDKTILEHCTLTFPSKGLMAIVGESGEGKSTFLKMLAGQLIPESGSVTFGNENIVNAAKKNISFGMQENILFPGTILENLKYAAKDISEEDVVNIMEELGVRERIDETKDGLYTVINEECDNLSGGQKQIVNICRAFLKNSAVVLLDEPTSSQSPEMEKKIMDRIKIQSEDKLIIIVTHARYVMDMADKVYILENRKLKEYIER